MMLSAYCTAHMLNRHGYPQSMQAVFQFLADYSSPIKRLQDDFAKVREWAAHGGECGWAALRGGPLLR